jgi:hypothetical protein
MAQPRRFALLAVAVVAFASNACVVHTVGKRTVHTAYVIDGRDPESVTCLDRCFQAAPAERPESDDEVADLKHSRERALRIAKCARRCPGVQTRPNEMCAEGVAGDGDASQTATCRDYVHDEPIRAANPVGIVGVAIGAVALIALAIAIVRNGIPMG